MKLLPKPRTCLKAALAAALLLAAGLAGLYLWLGTAAGASFVFSRLQSLAEAGGLTLAARSFEGPLPRRLEARGLFFEDGRGLRFTAEALEVEFRPAALLGGLIHLPLVRLDSPHLMAPPSPEDGQPAAPLPGWALRVDELAVTGPGLDLSAAAAGALDGRLAGRLRLRLAGDSPWLAETLAQAGLASPPASGDLDLSAELAWAASAGLTVNGLKLNGADWRWPDSRAAALLGPDWRLEGGFSGGGGGELVFNLEKFTAGGLGLTGRASLVPGPGLAGGDWRLDLEAGLADLAAALPGWSGPLNLTVRGELSGGRAAATVTAGAPRLDSPQGRWLGLEFEGGLAGPAAPEELSLAGRLALRVRETPGGPLTFATGWRFGRPEPERLALALEELEGRLAGLAFRGGFQASWGGGPPAVTGGLSAEADDWAALAALAGREISGAAARLRLDLAAADGRQNLTAGLDLPALNVAPDLALAKTSLKLTAADLFGRPDLNLGLTLGPGRAGPFGWGRGRARVTAEGGRGDAELSLAAVDWPGAAGGGRDSLAAAGTFDLGGAAAELTRLDLAAGPAGLRLTAPTALAWAGPLKAGPFKAALKPAGELSATFADLNPEHLNIKVGFSGPLAPLWRLAGLPDRSLTGQARLGLDLTGAAARPLLAGSLRVTGGRYEDKVLGLWLRNLELAADSGPDRALKFTLTGRDAGQGEMRLEGGIPDLAGPRLEARGTLKSFRPFNRDDVKLTVSGRLGASGPPDGLTLTADLTVDEGELDLNLVTAGGAAPTLPISDPDAPEEAGGGGGGALKLDVGVTAPGRFRVRGYGLDSEWRGGLKVKSGGGPPSLTGELRPVRGWFEPPVFGKQFDFAEESRVVFSGGLEPNLDLELTNQGPDLLAIINISGPARRPDIKLASRPPLSPDEVVARVLFGKSSASFSRWEALQLAAAMREITGLGGGGGGGLNPLQAVRSSLGLDVLRLGGGGREGGREISELTGSLAGEALGRGGSGGQAESAAASLEAGKYVSDKVYMGVEHGGDGPAVRLEVELLPHVSLEARSSPESSQVGLGWKKDY